MHQQPQHNILYAGTTSAGHRLQGTAAGAHWAMPQAACSQEPLMLDTSRRQTSHLACVLPAGSTSTSTTCCAALHGLQPTGLG